MSQPYAMPNKIIFKQIIERKRTKLYPALVPTIAGSGESAIDKTNHYSWRFYVRQRLSRIIVDDYGRLRLLAHLENFCIDESGLRG
jgi:hypothetical protein